MAIQAKLYRDNLGVGFSDLAGVNGNGGDLFSNQRELQLQMLQNQNQNQMLQQRLFDQNGFLGSGLMMNTRSPNCNVNDLYLEKQRREIDDYVRLQSERFRMALEEQRKQQLAAVVSEIKVKAMLLVAQKNQELAAAAKRTADLETLVVKLEVERQTWQRVARENETTVASLNKTLENLLDSGFHGTTAEDTGSCCGGDAVETEENRVCCRSCGGGEACMVFLPCRHLSSCRACEPFIDSCPVCQTVKKASIEALV